MAPTRWKPPARWKWRWPSSSPRCRRKAITIYPALHRPANFIERALASLEQSLVIAAVLILVVLFLFLRDWRSALITFLAIPLSLLAAVAVLERMGQTLNTMTLGGFAVALGVLVDDAIIGIENILRRLAENAKQAEPRPRLKVIADATLEVRGPVVYATLVVIAVFLPELFSTSVQGQFVGPLALAFILAVLASLLVALTAAPALCALMLSARDAHGDQTGSWGSSAWQRSIIDRVYRHFRVVGAVLVVATLAAGAALPFLGGSFMPDFREGHFVMQVTSSTPGASLEEMMRMGERISKDVLALPYVATVEQQVGRAALGEDTWGPHQSEFHVELKPDADVDQDQAQDELREILSHYPGLQTEVVTFLGDRISESLTGETADIDVKVFGDQLDTLDATGQRIAGALRGTPGIADLQFKPQSGTPTFALHIDPAALVANGLKMQDVLDAVQTEYAGATVGQTYAGTRIVDVALLLPEQARNRPELLSSMMIASPFGPVPLSQVARIAPTETRFKITHDGGQRFVSLTFNVVGRSLQATVEDAQARVAALKLPPGVYVEFTGAAEAQRAAAGADGALYRLRAGADRHDPVHLLSLARQYLAGAGQSALQPDRRGGGHRPDRQRLVGGRHGGAGDGVRRQRPQRHPAAGPLRASGRSRRRALECGDHPARGAGTAGAHPDDGGGDRAGPDAAGHRRQPAGAGNRRPHGGDGAGRPDHARPCSIWWCCRRWRNALADPSPRSWKRRRWWHDPHAASFLCCRHRRLRAAPTTAAAQPCRRAMCRPPLSRRRLQRAGLAGA